MDSRTFSMEVLQREVESFTCKSFNNTIDSLIIQAAIKLAYITPILEKGSKNTNQNYRTVSILLDMSKKCVSWNFLP